MKPSADETRRSYEKFHYGLRTAKNIERKMLCEALHRLSAFDRLDTYRYIGFGSAYFSDFILFHKSLGIDDLISIECDIDKAARFAFNCPFNCVTVEMGLSTEILPKLSWEKKSIVWLDYNDPLQSLVLADVAFFCANAAPGSVLLVTVDAQPGEDKEKGLDRLQRLEQSVGRAKVPGGVRKKDLAKWGTATVSRRIIDNEVRQQLHARSGALPAARKVQYRQLFNFHYADGAKMLTVGGMIYENGQTDQVDRSAFENLAFIRDGIEPFLIEAPVLTYRELRHLDSQLPRDSDSVLDAPGVPDNDVENYRLLYRYFPTFAEAEL